MTTDPKSRPRLPLESVRSMAELLRHSRPRAGNERPWTRGPQSGGQCLATQKRSADTGGGSEMGAVETRCVVGIDVAKQTHVICALEAPGGAIRLKPSQIEASADGYARLQGWLASWAGPEATVIGM